MKDAIYRQDAIDAVTKYCLQYDLRELLAEIETLPPAEPKQGKWMHYDEPQFDFDYKCSECGCAAWDDTDFCPNCGADMRGEGND